MLISCGFIYSLVCRSGAIDTLMMFTTTISVSNIYSTKMDIQEVGGGRGDRMELAQDRDGWRALVGTVRNFRVP